MILGRAVQKASHDSPTIQALTHGRETADDGRDHG